MKKKIVLAYSGDLDTTVIIAWLKENQDCDVTAVCVDIGQSVDFKVLKKRAMSAGAVDCQIIDAKKEFIEQYLWPVLKAGAVYDNNSFALKYAAYSLIAKTLVDFANSQKAAAIAHGAMCNGNTFILLAKGIKALSGNMEIITPWFMWKMKNRKDLMRYLARRKILVTEKNKDVYKIDSSIMFISHEGLDLENTENEPQYRKILSLSVSPERAPNKPEYIEISFDKGIPVSINGKTQESTALINQLNKTGGANGIGILEIIENHIKGKKTRVVYETPASCILSYAHQKLESICLDGQTLAFKKLAAGKMAKLVCFGKWFSPLRKALSAFVDNTQQAVNGKVKLKLYKGSISVAGISSPNSLITETSCEEPPKPAKKPAAASAVKKAAPAKKRATGKTAKKK